MTRPKKHAPEVLEQILETLRNDVPFISLCAEKCGVNRNTVQNWICLGENGDPYYEDFATQVRQIRSAFMLKHAQELLSTDRETSDRAKQRNWLLQRLDRTIFDPPHQTYEKTMSRTTPAEHATHPTAADPNKVAEAVLELSQPLTLQ